MCTFMQANVNNNESYFCVEVYSSGIVQTFSKKIILCFNLIRD